MLLVWFVIAAIPIGYILKGRLRNYINDPLNLVFFPVLAFMIEASFGKLTDITGKPSEIWLPWAVCFEYLLLALFISFNIRRKGMKLLGIATVLNFAVISLNGFRMPVISTIYDIPELASLVERIHNGNIPEYVIVEKGAPLWFLGDIIPIASGLASIGDIFMAIGMLVLIVGLMRTPEKKA